MYPHRIRLRGPWECDAGAGLRRVALPCPWEQLVAPDVGGPIRLVRSFGYPGRLDDFERVWLTFAGVRGQADVALNGQPLGPGQGDFDVEVTAQLRPRNRLEVTLAADTPTGTIWDEVALEIRRDTFLRAAARRAGRDAVEVSGVVVGPAGPVLELYALVGGRNLHYQTIEAGQSFHFTLTGLDAACPVVRVELVHVATIWYAADLPVAVA